TCDDPTKRPAECRPFRFRREWTHRSLQPSAAIRLLESSVQNHGLFSFAPPSTWLPGCPRRASSKPKCAHSVPGFHRRVRERNTILRRQTEQSRARTLFFGNFPEGHGQNRDSRPDRTEHQ